MGKARADSVRAEASVWEAGQATVEYILLLSFVMSLGIGMTRAMIAGVDEGVLIFGAALEKDLQTGRMPPGDWAEE